MTVGRLSGWVGALPFLLAIATVHLVLAWPGAGARGVIAEEAQPYLRHYPKVLEPRDVARFLPPNDDPAVVRAIDRGEVQPRWVGTPEWPEVSYLGRTRVWPIFVRGHQTALGTFWGIATGPLLGGGIGGIRRSSVLMGLGLVFASWGLCRRLGLSRGWASVAALGCIASPGLWFFSRTGYGFELLSRVLMLIALFLAAPRVALTWPRSVAVGGTLALAILSRATIAVTLLPGLLLMLSHPRRWAGPLRVGSVLAIGGGVPVALVVVAVGLLPFAAGTTPAAALQIGDLARRTLVAPSVALLQLAWVVDPRIVLSRLVLGDLHVGAGWLRASFASVVVGAALWRWWHGRAGEAERIFVGGLIGNALGGAWLYGNPAQFQLGMALEPLFVAAVAQQLSSVSRERARGGIVAAAGMLGLRAFTLASLWSNERRTDNPMLSGRAQRGLVELLHARGVRGDDLVTTTYNDVGVVEVLTNETLRPIHAWPALRADAASGRDLTGQWAQILDAWPVCHVLLTRAPNLVAGPFTDNPAVKAALERAVLARGGHIVGRSTVEGDGGGVVFEIVDLAPCRRDASVTP